MFVAADFVGFMILVNLPGWVGVVNKVDLLSTVGGCCNINYQKTMFLFSFRGDFVCTYLGTYRFLCVVFVHLVFWRRWGDCHILPLHCHSVTMLAWPELALFSVDYVCIAVICNSLMLVIYYAEDYK